MAQPSPGESVDSVIRPWPERGPVRGALLLAILATVAAFWLVSRGAAILMLPYLGWVSFAAYLNFHVWAFN